MQIKIGNRTYSLLVNKMQVANEMIVNIGYAVSITQCNATHVQNRATILQIKKYGSRVHIGLHTRKQLLQKI